MHCRREDQAGSGVSCFIPYILLIFLCLIFHLPISFTPPPPSRAGKKTQQNPNSESFVFVSMGILREGEGVKENRNILAKPD